MNSHISHTLQDYGLVFISNDAQEEEEKAKDKKKKKRKKKKAAAEAGTAALVTPDALEVLKRVEGSLGEKETRKWTYF